MLFALRTREDMDAAHARQERTPSSNGPARPALRNIGPVLDLGNTIFFTFRGRAYGVPPVPYKLGQELVALRLAAPALGQSLTRENAKAYFAYLHRLPALLWPHTRPAGRVRRWRKRLGLLRNPFKNASEAELVALADFFQARRMASGVLLRPDLSAR